jgi:oxygen-independent coproporphyrinogen-3 oxidase
MDVGFDNINIDLISSLPGQTIDTWQKNLETAVNLNTTHISAYTLIFEENTLLFNMRKLGKVKNIDIELERQMYDLTWQHFTANGFEHYEISNFAKPGYECRHNLKYWQLEEYISFGPSASSFVNGKRWTNVRNLLAYLRSIESGKSAVEFEEKIEGEKAVTEHIFLGLRSRGIDINRFNETFNCDFREKYLTSITMLVNNGFAEVDNNLFRLTPKGYAMCDEIVTSYF